VRYEIDAPPQAMYHCHCSTCRAASGSGFATNILVATASFRVVLGSTSLRGHASSPGKLRHFCGHCGSPIYSQGETTSDRVSVRAGTLHRDPGIRPGFHAYVDSKAPWVEIGDGLRQFAQAPAGP
jgi:hypothetical protein